MKVHVHSRARHSVKATRKKSKLTTGLSSIIIALTILELVFVFNVNQSLIATTHTHTHTPKLQAGQFQIDVELHHVASSPSSSSSSSSSRPQAQPVVPHPLHIVPKEPDLSIGEYLRSILPSQVANGTNTIISNASVSESPFTSCSPTSQVIISSLSTSNSNSTSSDNFQTNNHTRTWIIEALDEEGHKKTYGGDEFYVTYTDHNKNKSDRPTAVATIKDRRDGTYKLDFVSLGFGANIPLSDITGMGSLGISILYTCDIGRMTRPSKDLWKTGGHLHHSTHTYTVENVTAPPIRQVRRPNIDIIHDDDDDDDDGGTTSESTTKKKKIDLSKYDQVLCFGDSLLENFCGNNHGKPQFKQFNVKVSENVGRLIRSDTLEEAFIALDETFGMELNHSNTIDIGNISSDIHTSDNNNKNKNNNNNKKKNTDEKAHEDERVSTFTTALILDSANWELCSNMGPLPGRYFNNSLQMYRDYILGIRARYPQTTIYWKSPQAIHPIQLKERCYTNNEWCVSRLRYASPSNMEYLYHEQKRIMNELNVEFLDLWEITHVSETWHMDGDQSHYRHWFNMYLLDSFYPESMRLLKG